MSKTFNHAYMLAFEVAGSTDPEGEDVTPAILRAALMQRIATLDATPNKWVEAIGTPFNTYEE